ncbi:hypothetical protein CesoFtcFv8_001243 [Champsocephalus esox]|uniref:Uncharacterized protein n=2 Tax=Champsocephalus TaxID=52236 RepID=A0AAN8E6E7_CHAGU|nr:hypothetical protein CesoFtcFv8_001243 [Champsocephalus esox]KAK5935615.1 hypothetical protein CgunFtcFv8_020962 [Champsocephalus gunnari]
MEAAGGALQVPIEQVGKPPLWASKEWTTMMIGGAPVGSGPPHSAATRRSAREMACCMPRHRAMPLTAMPGGSGRGAGGAMGRPEPSETQRCVSLLLQDTIV